MSAPIQAGPFTSHEARTVTTNIDQNTAASHIIAAVDPGQMFIVYHIRLDNHSGSTVVLTIQSEGTTIGTLQILTASTVEHRNSGFPVWHGRASGDDLVITWDSANRVTGWVTWAALQHVRIS